MRPGARMEEGPHGGLHRPQGERPLLRYRAPGAVRGEPWPTVWQDPLAASGGQAGVRLEAGDRLGAQPANTGQRRRCPSRVGGPRRRGHVLTCRTARAWRARNGRLGTGPCCAEEPGDDWPESRDQQVTGASGPSGSLEEGRPLRRQPRAASWAWASEHARQAVRGSAAAGEEGRRGAWCQPRGDSVAIHQ